MVGYLMRKFGLPIDGLRSCDVVTADGEFVVAHEDENPDRFWSLRGRGPPGPRDGPARSLRGWDRVPVAKTVVRVRRSRR